LLLSEKWERIDKAQVGLMRNVWRWLEMYNIGYMGREGSSMQLTEQQIDRSDPRYSVVDAAAFKSKGNRNDAAHHQN
jgi:hypothetical protein